VQCGTLGGLSASALAFVPNPSFLQQTTSERPKSSASTTTAAFGTPRTSKSSSLQQASSTASQPPAAMSSGVSIGFSSTADAAAQATASSNTSDKSGLSATNVLILKVVPATILGLGGFDCDYCVWCSALESLMHA
jgi:hypothetical protein